MIQEKTEVKGRLLIIVKDEKGQVKEKREIPNLVVTTGLGFISSRMKDATATVMSHIAVGTDNTAAALGQTALVTELARVALSSTTVTGPAIEYSATFPAGTGTGALVEAGIFNATPAGTMLARTVFSVVNKAAGDTLVITWTITLG